MKAKERHELQTNDLAQWIDSSLENVAPYARAITAALVAAAILLGVYLYVTASARRASAAAADQLLAAFQRGNPGQELQATIGEHPGSQPALIAQLLFAEQEFLARGESLLFVNKTAARELLTRAVDAFATTGRATADPMLRAWATFGMGRALESLGDLDRARQVYQSIVTEDPNGALAAQAQQHLDDLDRQSTKEFYDWFAKQDPRPAPEQSAPGTPGVKPSFDLQEPASSGDIKLPSSLQINSPGSEPASGPSMPTGEAPIPGEK